MIANLHDLKGLDSARMWYVWTAAQIDQRPATIDCGASAVWNLVIDDMLLVLVVPKHVEQIVFRRDQTFEGLLFLDDLAGDRLQRLPVGGLNDTTAGSISECRIFDLGGEAYLSGRAIS